MRNGLLVASLVIAVLLVSSAGATTAWAREPRSEFNFSIDLRDYYLRAMPRFTLSDPLKTPLRDVSGTLPSTGAQHFLGVALDTSYILGNLWEFPILGLMGAGAIGRSPRVVTSLDGSVVNMRPWTSGAFSFLLPGVGVRATARRWKFALTVRPVASLTWMSVAVANGKTFVDTSDQQDSSSILAATFGARAEVTVCRRVDPTLRACLFVAPNLYEYGALNGGSVGFRLELGP